MRALLPEVIASLLLTGCFQATPSAPSGDTADSFYDGSSYLLRTSRLDPLHNNSTIIRSPPIFDGHYFLNETATTEIYTLSLHDALPISNSSALISLLAELF